MADEATENDLYYTISITVKEYQLEHIVKKAEQMYDGNKSMVIRKLIEGDMKDDTKRPIKV